MPFDIDDEVIVMPDFIGKCGSNKLLVMNTYAMMNLYEAIEKKMDSNEF